MRQRYERLQQHSTALSAEAEWDEIAPLLHTALGGLPDDLRLPLVLLYLQGRTQQDVATELAVSQATVSRRASEGIEHLRTTLRRMGVQAAAAAMIGGLAADSQAAVPAVAARVARQSGTVWDWVIADAGQGRLELVAGLDFTGCRLSGGWAESDIVQRGSGDSTEFDRATPERTENADSGGPRHRIAADGRFDGRGANYGTERRLYRTHG